MILHKFDFLKIWMFKRAENLKFFFHSKSVINGMLLQCHGFTLEITNILCLSEIEQKADTHFYYWRGMEGKQKGVWFLVDPPSHHPAAFSQPAS